MNSEGYEAIIGVHKILSELRTRAEVAEARLAGTEERCKILLEAKNLWMERALAAEKKTA